MFLYLVYAPSKSGTTSLYQALTENAKFPVIQTHDDITEVGIHDTPNDTKFSHYVKNNFKEYLKPVNEFDGEVKWTNRNAFQSYALYFGNDRMARERFMQLLRQFKLKIVTPLRNPISRSISALIHWLHIDGINALYNTILGKPLDLTRLEDDDINKLGHYPIQLMLKKYKENGSLSIVDVADIYNTVFHEDLYREYICVFYNLRMYFGFNICLNRKPFYHKQISENNWSLFAFRLEDIKDIQEHVYNYLGIPKTYKLPTARDKSARTNYLIEGDIKNIAKEIAKRSAIDSSTSVFYD